MFLLMTLGSSIGWTALDFARKKLSDFFSAILVVILIMTTQGVLNLGLGGADVLFEQDQKWWLSAFASIVLNSIANVLFVLSVLRAPYTLTIPLLSLSPAIAASVGYLIFDEALTFKQILGTAFIVIAALGIGLRGEKRLPTRKESVGLVMMVLTACLWATTPFFDKYCTASGAVPAAPYMVVQCLGIALVLLPFLILPNERRATAFVHLRSLKPWVWVFVAALGSTLGLWLQLTAIASHPVGTFEAAKRSLNLILALLAGKILLGEKITSEKVIAVIAMAVGIALISTD